MNDPTDRQGRPGEPARPERHVHPCPQCGALRAADNAPTCACAQRASDALRDTREAEVAAAEGFDPLRIRPYVELGEGAGDGGEAAAGDATTPLPAVRPAPPGDAAADATMVLRAVDPSGTAPVPTPLAPSGSTPSDTDLSLFEAGEDSGSGRYDDEEAPGGRRRRTLLIASAGAAVAVIAAAGFASGLFSYETPTRDQAAPEEVRAAVPDTSTSAPATSPSASRSASPSASSASPSPSESASASPSATESSASPSPSRTTEPSPSAPTTQATESLTPGNGAEGGSGEVTVLRRGDRGPEVTELQLRLRQVYLFNDEANGVFGNRVEEALRNYQWSRGIKGDELGEYGSATRTSLESETKEP
ncbi:peptidoglycan-binding protein [Streptomyces phaeoluteigriseus]|uniref:Peptidoglycan-binding protein n=1 Tax=Streptomyces phaeoluteigriseus TaxID=114686 RepID=A0ABY4ZGE4_9ACTN|nr:peptidoglycan-binding domain-containing protein [Streptomyces phaeoluteigriseus]USQ88046.1 peptidoglycan-binding protein [Streptomyces phaeoluteigriseus]